MGRDALMDRFMKKVEMVPESGCWIWTASVFNQKRGEPYGCFSVKHKVLQAHRVSFELFKGAIPPGMCVCHRCDVTLCVNPDHLFLGTASDNMRDAIAKGRWNGWGMRRASGWRATGRKAGWRLSEYQRAEVLRLRIEGCTIRAIAGELGIGRTVAHNVIKASL